MLTYTPESPITGGYAIAAGRRVALIGSDASIDVALVLHRYLADPRTPMSMALDVVRESTVCKRFAVVELAADGSQHAEIALRGDVRVDLGSAAMSRFTWPEGATWVTATADDVELVRLSLGEAPEEAPHLPFSEGVVHASDLVVSVADVPAPRTVAPEPVDDESDDELTVLLEETVEHARARGSQGLAPLSLDDIVIPPGLDDLASADADAPTPSATPTPSAASPDTPGAPSPVPAPPVAAAPVPPTPSAVPPPAPPSRAPQRVDLSSLMRPVTWTLRLPDGNELEAGSSIIVGRRPWRSDPDETSTYYIVAPSPGRQISGKHLEFSVVDNELQARDLESTNGTLLLQPDRPPRLLTAGRSVTLDTGDTLDLGEGFQIVVGERR